MRPCAFSVIVMDTHTHTHRQITTCSDVESNTYSSETSTAFIPKEISPRLLLQIIIKCYSISIKIKPDCTSLSSVTYCYLLYILSASYLLITLMFLPQCYANASIIKHFSVISALCSKVVFNPKLPSINLKTRRTILWKLIISRH